MSQYFPPYRSSRRSIKVKLDLRSYATKTDLKNVTHVDVSSFALKTNLVNLKTKVDKSDIAKLVPVPHDLAKLSNVVKNYIVKKTVYDKLVTKVNSIDTTGFVLETKYDIEKSDLEKKISDAEKKIPDNNSLVKKTDNNSKITEIENKIPYVSGLVKKTGYNAKITEIEGKIPNVSNLVKKADYNTKFSEIESKYITTPDYNKFTENIVDNNIKSKNLVTKTDYDPRH